MRSMSLGQLFKWDGPKFPRLPLRRGKAMKNWSQALLVHNKKKQMQINCADQMWSRCAAVRFLRRIEKKNSPKPCQATSFRSLFMFGSACVHWNCSQFINRLLTFTHISSWSIIPLSKIISLRKSKTRPLNVLKSHNRWPALRSVSHSFATSEDGRIDGQCSIRSTIPKSSRSKLVWNLRH